MGLIVSAIILALTLTLSGCVAPPGVKAPGFLEAGGTYKAITPESDSLWFTVVEIRRDGWILAEPIRLRYAVRKWDHTIKACLPGYDVTIWINPIQLVYVAEVEVEWLPQ
ncbi:hypothetical protein M1N42_03180 [Thermodesulfovibrionales bacterium]|nr:hypothetical protein [Thermodesulfovibrionales bacterium]